MTVVFLCIGAAKAGTDWLYRQLSTHPECHFRSIKELHFFDALEGGRLGRELEKHHAQQSDLLERLATSGRTPSADQARRLADRGAWMDVLETGTEAAYLNYLQDGAGQARVVGDMTPAYALLNRDRLTKMSRLGDDVRFLYLLRDPVERLWSHVRMIAARRDEDGRVTRQRCARLLDRVFSGKEDQIACRSDYAGTLARLMAAVPGGQLLVEAFEDMVQGDGLTRLCQFLGIAPMASDPAPVHTGQPLEMTRDQRQTAANWLAPQYDAALDALGRMPQGWNREG